MSWVDGFVKFETELVSGIVDVLLCGHGPVAKLSEDVTLHSCHRCAVAVDGLAVVHQVLCVFLELH